MASFWPMTRCCKPLLHPQPVFCSFPFPASGSPELPVHESHHLGQWSSFRHFSFQQAVSFVASHGVAFCAIDKFSLQFGELPRTGICAARFKSPRPLAPFLLLQLGRFQLLVDDACGVWIRGLLVLPLRLELARLPPSGFAQVPFQFLQPVARLPRLSPFFSAACSISKLHA